jgi:glutamate synthase (NADPH/NADH) small chain
MVQAIPSGELAIDRKERVRVPYLDLDLRDPDQRVTDFEDVYIPFDPERARFEASRCIHCPDPAPCVVACPTDNDIVSAMWLIEQGEFIEAARLYRQTSSLPEVCGRVCPHEQLCEGSCVRNKCSEPVLCGALEAFVADYEREAVGVEIPVGPPSGKRVAIVGSGPAGLACADLLVQEGHSVTIFDTKPAPGGLMTYGIPNFKLPKTVVFNRISDFERAGVEFVNDTYIGKDKTIDDLFNEGFQAVFIGVGSQVDAPLKADGVDLPGVYLATDFLIRANVPDEVLPPEMKVLPDLGRMVVVVGGGDTASDSLRSAVRLGANNVTCLYRRTENEMPGSSKDRKLAAEEGARYQYLTQPIRFISDEDGHLAAVECLRMELGEPDESGRRRPVPIEGSEFIVKTDTAVLALGYWPDPIIGDTTPGLDTHSWGLITTEAETGQTTRPKVYAGGDAVTGPDLVVTAMVAGRKAAMSINKLLKE